jgi:hypothetical protein
VGTTTETSVIAFNNAFVKNAIKGLGKRKLYFTQAATVSALVLVVWLDGRTGVLIAAGAVIVVIVVAVVSMSGEEAGPAVGAPNQFLSKEPCERAGGHWNDCSPACREMGPDQSCSRECVQECECEGFAGWRCPEGFACAEYFPNRETPDAVGVCRKSG